MASTAISSQNTVVRVATASSSPVTITAITAANPPVVTATAHGLTNGTVVVVASVGGMVEVNGRAFVVANVATNTFELKGVDGTGYTAYTSGGTATPQTMTEVANVTSASLFEGESGRVDKTNLRSRVIESVAGLADFGSSSIEIHVDPTDPGQVRLRNLVGTATPVALSFAMGSGQVAVGMFEVASFPASVSVNALWSGSVSLFAASERAFFA